MAFGADGLSHGLPTGRVPCVVRTVLVVGCSRVLLSKWWVLGFMSSEVLPQLQYLIVVRVSGPWYGPKSIEILV